MDVSGDLKEVSVGFRVSHEKSGAFKGVSGSYQVVQGDLRESSEGSRAFHGVLGVPGDLRGVSSRLQGDPRLLQGASGAFQEHSRGPRRCFLSGSREVLEDLTGSHPNNIFYFNRLGPEDVLRTTIKPK